MRQTVRSSDGRLWGIVEDDVYRTHRKQSKHFVRKYSAWGIQAEIVYWLKHLGVKTVEVIDMETGTKYISSLDDWLAFGRAETLNPIDGLQIFLSINHFRKEKINNMKLDNFSGG